MSDGMERIMREIHVMFAKAEKVPSREDMIVVDKKRVFALLEALNHEVYDAMDRYEESRTSRELAIQKFKEETDSMVERASESAEEIYAGSILYSDSTLKELEDEVAQARENIQKTWEDIDRRIGDRLRYLEKNRAELKGQLEQMEQGRVYLELIGKVKRAEKEEQEEQKSLNRPEKKVVVPVPDKQGAVIPDDFAENTGGAADSFEELDVLDSLIDLDDFEEGGLTEEQKKIEIHVAEAYRDRGAASGKETETPAAMQEFHAEDFDLDAEYFAWKEEINGAPPAYPTDAKKGLRGIFKRVK